MRFFRVIHVEDEEDIREVVAISLGLDPCFEVRGCASGAEALSTAAEWAPDLILCDVVMPVMDGPATVANLRERPQTAKTPVIFMTARVQRWEVERLKTLGAAGIIYKPFEPMTLAGQIRNQIRAASMATLSNNFSERLRSDAAALAKSRLKLGNGGGPEAVEEIKMIAHALAGAAGIFRCDRIGDEAATLERASIKRIRGDDKPGDLECDLDRLLACIANQ
jgi:CheY-like chemotaxis protein